MVPYVIKQLKFVRQLNINLAKSVNEAEALQIIEGHNNHILWNLGHLYVVLEKFTFGWLGEEANRLDELTPYFGNGSNPKDWDEKVPNLKEMIELLENQLVRIETELSERTKEVYKKPYVTSSGFQLDSVEELMSFSLYHEGMHLGIMKSIKQKL